MSSPRNRRHLSPPPVDKASSRSQVWTIHPPPIALRAAAAAAKAAYSST